MDAGSLQQWVGREQQAADEVTLPAARRVAALLDRAEVRLAKGDVLPDGWYVMLFTPTERHSGLAADGHPAKGSFLPPVPLPRRMFAGRRVGFHDALRIGDAVTRASRITRIEAKTGRSGEMCFVTLRHEIASPRGLAVVEEQDIVYRGAASLAGAGGAAKPVVPAPSATWDFSRTLVPGPALLFRYSAITFNAHRIHYDTAYTQGTEGYPDLVVNGGLTTLLMWDVAAAETGRRLVSSTTRNVKALYVNRPLTLCGRMLDGNRLRVLALDAAGEPAIEAELGMA